MSNHADQFSEQNIKLAAKLYSETTGEGMMNNVKQALEYVRNTNGGATWDNFMEDAEPIGPMLRRDLDAGGYVEERDGKIFLTTAGENHLASRVLNPLPQASPNDR